MARIAPLSGGFMITSIVGFIASLMFVYKISAAWGMAFMIFFVIMFVSSMISMTKAPVSEQSFREKKSFE
jgi:hypothetical protein